MDESLRFFESYHIPLHRIRDCSLVLNIWKTESTFVGGSGHVFKKHQIEERMQQCSSLCDILEHMLSFLCLGIPWIQAH